MKCFNDEQPEMSLSEISQCVGLHKATAHRIVTTLVNHGFLERATGNQKYRLGLQLTELGFQAVHRLDVRREALPYMHQLIEKLGEACDLSIFDRGEVFYIEFVQGSHALTVAAAIGQRLPAYCTASGKVFLANLPEEAREATLQGKMTAYTARTITAIEALRRQLEAVSRQGYGVDDEEFELGIRAVSAPIRDQKGRVIAALSTPGPANRITSEKIPIIGAALVETGDAISRRLGWNGK
jgi:IclR family KDG regulon transcriptional repressor